MPDTDIEIDFLSHHRKAQSKPDPKYPLGICIDLSDGKKTQCSAALPYPAECCGVLLVRCRTCGANAAITTAGRSDDPRRVILACKSASPADRGRRGRKRR